MDLGFVDPEDGIEALAKAQASGKEPDRPFDDDGRDVFEGYSFHGLPLPVDLPDQASVVDHGPDSDEPAVVETEDQDGLSSTQGHTASSNSHDNATLEVDIQDNTGAMEQQDQEEQQDQTPSGHLKESTNASTEVSEGPLTSPSLEAVSRHAAFTSKERDYDTGPTSVSSTDDDFPKHTKDTSGGYHVRAQSSALGSLAEEDHEKPLSPTARLDKHLDETSSIGIKPSSSHLANVRDDVQVRSSIEMPRRSQEGQSKQPDNVEASDEARQSESALSPPFEQPRISEEGSDWDIVEALNDEQMARNGAPGPAAAASKYVRKRVMAGPTTLARGIVDNYRLKIKPLARAPTPSRSYTSKSALSKLNSSSRQSSSSNINRLHSASPNSVRNGGGTDASDTSFPLSTSHSGELSGGAGPSGVANSKKKNRPARSPRLLRASTEWMTNSLPSTPTPRFRMKRKKPTLSSPSTAEEGGESQGDATGDTSSEAVSPIVDRTAGSTPSPPEHLAPRCLTPASVESARTLPIEAAGAPLSPLTRSPVVTRHDTTKLCPPPSSGFAPALYPDDEAGTATPVPNVDDRSEAAATPKEPMSSQGSPKTVKFKKFSLDPAKLGFLQSRSKSNDGVASPASAQK